LSLADLILAPQLYYLAATPEGSAALKDTALLTWLGRMNGRPSMKVTLPPAPLRQGSVNQPSSRYSLADRKCDEHTGSVASLPSA
jgi:hypothetical protein